MKAIIVIALIAMFSWAWASKEEPEDMMLGGCYTEGQDWFCR